MKLFLTAAMLLFVCLNCEAQGVADTSSLNEVVVKAYFSDQPILRVPSSISVVDQQTLENQAPGSLLPAINTAPGVRMEERSPGSYRLSIRGSLLRSPFGIRNVKIYLDDFLLTDAGGNTYLNALDASDISRVEVLKGPEGSIFGANSGGVVLVNSATLSRDSSIGSASLSGGSYGLLHQSLSFQTKKNSFNLGVNQSYMKSSGYRQNSALDRTSVRVRPSWKYSPSAEISSLLMYSDLAYETPGGLTQAQLENDPRSARPGTSVSPGAIDQQAAIYNKTGLIGISHSKMFGSYLRHVIALTGSFTDFANPFITTYELRDEKSLGLRTFLELTSNTGRWTLQTGYEAQQTRSEKRNFVNLSGEPGEAQDFVDFQAKQSFLFARISGKISERLSAEAALSLNYYQYSFSGIFPQETPNEKRKFQAQLMPRMALSYLISNSIAIRASASRGYSPPTIEEVRPSNRIINSNLQPEAGWNYEGGLRISILNNRVYFDGVLFNFKLKDAIVRRVDAADTEFFVNAGSTNQTGIEMQYNAWIKRKNTVGFLRGLKAGQSYTYSNFKFDEYTVASEDYSGNYLTGVPENNLVSLAEVYLPKNLQLYVQHSYVSSIPLNDANTAYAANYHLLQARVSVKKRIKTVETELYAGGDNLLNTSYSLGNDLNAFGSRFFNPAALRTFFAGARVRF